MGGDSDIESAARTSYQKGTRKISDTRGLIRSLVRDSHGGPMEFVEFTFHLKIPLCVAAQLVRHRTSSFNFSSYRYSEVPDETYFPSEERYLKQSKDNKQGSSDEPYFNDSDNKYGDFTYHQDQANEVQFAIYQTLIGGGCSREIARIHLPQSVYTECYWKMDLRNLLHFLKLRLDPHAQWEIREYARIVAGFVKHYVPITWEAFEDYQLYARTFTQDEIRLLQTDMTPEDINSELEGLGYKNRERQNFWEKLKPAKKIDYTLGD
jgi:thymidylate synthase (FAD)